MDWYNSEHYPDFTAGEAMSRVMAGHPPEEDDGIRRLAEAVVRQAVYDYCAALRLLRVCPEAAEQKQEAEEFFRSERFRCLTGLDGSAFIRMAGKEIEQE